MQVLACGAPPDRLLRTLRSLSRVDYPELEVQVLADGAAASEGAVGKALVAWGRRAQLVVCGECCSRASLLNEATARLDPGVELVAVLEAGQEVRRDLLATLAPHFDDSRVAFVKTPRGAGGRLGRLLLRAPHRVLGLASEDVLPAGSVRLLRVSALRDVGGWSEACAGDEAEAALRILARGYQAVYVGPRLG